MHDGNGSSYNAPILKLRNNAEKNRGGGGGGGGGGAGGDRLTDRKIETDIWLD